MEAVRLSQTRRGAERRGGGRRERVGTAGARAPRDRAGGAGPREVTCRVPVREDRTSRLPTWTRAQVAAQRDLSETGAPRASVPPCERIWSPFRSGKAPGSAPAPWEALGF